MLTIEREEGGRLDCLQTILAAAKGSVGSLEYQHVFIRREAYTEDVTNGGEYSCALTTTAIFHRFGLLRAPHTTVDGFEQEVRMRSSDWVRCDGPVLGAVGILEGKIHLDGSVKNRHTFICVTEEMAVHNGLEDGVWAPRLCNIEDFKHHTGAERKAEAYYLHRLLME